MRNKLVAAAIAGLVAVPAGAQAEAEVNWFGFNQITANTGGADAQGDGGGLQFGADRIRIGYKAKFDSGAFSKLQVDFNSTGVDNDNISPGDSISNTNQLPNIIKDAVVGYDFGPANVQVGMRKTPIGMDFNTSGKKLDIIKRGMEKDYVLERTNGAYVFGNASGVGYAAFIGNPATRSGAVDEDRSVNDAGNFGETNSYGGRLDYSMGKLLYAEISYGMSAATDTVNNAEDYSVFDIGVKSMPMPGLTLKAEYLDASNVDNVDSRDQTVWFAHAGYEFTPMVEGVVRHYNSEHDPASGSSSTVSETWIGANFFLNPEVHHEARIQLFYAMAGGDTKDSDYGGGNSAGDFHRIKGAQYNADDGDYDGAIWAMFQTSF
ncbi:hypothetical protein [Thiohalorhabdus methylotrophus]|uniref:Porin n=1 Tax=Thiohalorhabdus methylotrophus TaxID=3242694 RepID=A0ABV4TWV5_9GAMM